VAEVYQVALRVEEKLWRKQQTYKEKKALVLGRG